MKSASAELSLDFLTVSALSGAERALGAAAQLERAGRCCRASDSGTHTCCGSATVKVLVSSASGPRVSGCIRDFGDFRPHPVTLMALALLASFAVSFALSQIAVARKACTTPPPTPAFSRRGGVN